MAFERLNDGLGYQRQIRKAEPVLVVCNPHIRCLPNLLRRREVQRFMPVVIQYLFFAIHPHPFDQLPAIQGRVLNKPFKGKDY